VLDFVITGIIVKPEEYAKCVAPAAVFCSLDIPSRFAMIRDYADIF
jgi:hypothetical protein